jgi:hypothetical protein
MGAKRKKAGARAEKSETRLRRGEKKRLSEIERLEATNRKAGMSKADARAAANRATRKTDSTR